MPLKTAKYLNILVALLMALDLVGTGITAIPAHNEGKIGYHIKHAASTGLAFLLFEKEVEEETEKDEGEREKFVGAELVDFSKVAVLLCYNYTHIINFISSEQRFSVKPPLFTLHCNLII